MHLYWCVALDPEPHHQAWALQVASILALLAMALRAIQ
jgi:hypothetical protein